MGEGPSKLTNLKICLLASGSSGNCGYIAAGDTRILIDAGVSRSRVIDGLTLRGLDASRIDALFITHEHSDHAGEARRYASHWDCPIYASRRTGQKLVHLPLGIRATQSFRIGDRIEINSLIVEPIRVFHDAVEPVGFLVHGPSESGDESITVAYATDLGTVQKPLAQRLREVDGLIIESNHDLDMLINGPYAWHHKQRIRSPVGHLSNQSAAELIADLVQHGRLRAAMLTHLSETNNRPELALETVRNQLDGLFHCDVTVAPRDRPSLVLEL